MIPIRDCMKKKVFTISSSGTLRDAVRLLVEHHIGLLPVLDPEGKLLGVVGLRDLLTLALPSIMPLLTDWDFVGDFGAVESYLPSDEEMSQPVTSLMQPRAMVTEDSGVLRAYALMLQHELHDLPIVDQEGRLVGIASRVDIGTKILHSWLKET